MFAYMHTVYNNKIRATNTSFIRNIYYFSRVKKNIWKLFKDPITRKE